MMKQLQNFSRKKQEKEERLGGHLAVSSLLLELRKLALEPSLEQQRVYRLFFSVSLAIILSLDMRIRLLQ